MKRHRGQQHETFNPLDHDHGRRMEADFGTINVDSPNGRRQVSVLILVWSYSNVPFAMASPTKHTEATLEGVHRAFEFFGKVPREVWCERSGVCFVRFVEISAHQRIVPQHALIKRLTIMGVSASRIGCLWRLFSLLGPSSHEITRNTAVISQQIVNPPCPTLFQRSTELSSWRTHCGLLGSSETLAISARPCNTEI